MEMLVPVYASRGGFRDAGELCFGDGLDEVRECVFGFSHDEDCKCDGVFRVLFVLVYLVKRKRRWINAWCDAIFGSISAEWEFGLTGLCLVRVGGESLVLRMIGVLVDRVVVGRNSE